MADVSAFLERSNEESLYISMGTTMRMMLLFTQSSSIHRANVGSHAIVFKSQPWSIQTKTGSAAFSKVSVLDLENAGVV